MTAVVVPKPGDVLDTRTLHERCDAIDRWAGETDDVDALQAARAGLSAIDEYLLRTSVAGRARVQASLRQLEVRIGELLGPADLDGKRRNQHSELSTAVESSISKDERSAFRRMAAHRDVVDEVIAGSSDERPASRARVLRTIDERTRGGGSYDGPPASQLARMFADRVGWLASTLDTFGVERLAEAVEALASEQRESLAAACDVLLGQLGEIRRRVAPGLRRVQ